MIFVPNWSDFNRKKDSVIWYVVSYVVSRYPVGGNRGRWTQILCSKLPIINIHVIPQNTLFMFCHIHVNPQIGWTLKQPPANPRVVYMVVFSGIVSSYDAPSWRHFACIFNFNTPNVTNLGFKRSDQNCHFTDNKAYARGLGGFF